MKMKEFISDESNVSALLRPLGFWGKKFNYFVYSEKSTSPALAILGIFGALGALVYSIFQDFFVINISEKGVSLIEVTKMNWNMTEDVSYIPWTDIRELGFSEDGKIYKLLITLLNGSTRSFRVPPFGKFESKQGENIMKLLELSNGATDSK